MVMLIVGATMLVNSPRVQQRVSVLLATELENRIGTRVSLGGVHWLFPNDLVIDSLAIDDQEGERMFSVERVAIKVEWMPLIRHRHLSVRNVRLFSPDINIYKASVEEDYNYQFLVDAFASKSEKEKKPTRLSLRINSLLIRHANFRHHVCGAEEVACGDGGHCVPGKLSFDNLAVSDLSAQLSLKMLSADSASFIVRHLNLKEQSGLCVDDLYFRLVANRRGATLANFCVKMPRSEVALDTVWVAFNGEESQTGVQQSQLFFKGGISSSSYVTLADFGCLLPKVGGISEKVYVNGAVVGSPSRISLKGLDVHSARRDVAIDTDVKLAWEDNSLELLTVDLREASLTEKAWTMFSEQAPQLYSLIPEQLVNVGNVKAKGSASYNDGMTIVDLQTTTGAGNVKTQVSLDREGGYAVIIEGDGLKVEQVVPEIPLASTDLALQAKGTIDVKALTERDEQVGLNNLPLTGTLMATATHVDLLGYEYESFALNGSYASGEYQATLALDDPKGAFALEAGYHTEGRVPRYTATLRADSLDLHAMQLIDIHEDASFSTRLNVDLRGRDVDHIVGKVLVDSFAMHRDAGDYVIEEIALYASDPNDKMLSLKSDFVDATLRGELTYRSLVNSLLGHLHNSIPSLCQSTHHAHSDRDNLCLASISVYNVEPLRELFLLPVNIAGKAQFDVLMNDVAGELNLAASVPELEYDGNILKGISVDCHSSDKGLDVYVGGTLQNDDAPALTASLITSATDDVAEVGLLWNSNPAGMFEGTFRTCATFALDEEGRLGVKVEADSTSAVLNHSEWTLDPFSVEVKPEYILVDGLHFASGAEQHLSADGVIAYHNTDTLKVNFNNLDLGYLLSFVKLGDISFDGKVSGHANMANLYSEQPYIEARLNAQDFAFCDGVLGDMKGGIHWNQEASQLQFKADVWETPRHTTMIDGLVDLKQDELWIDIAADSTNVSFLNTLLKSFMSDIKGNATGHLVVGGPLKAIDLDGALMTDVAFTLTPTDVDYYFKDSLRFTPGVIRFDGIEAFDMRDQKAIVSGAVTHNAIKDFAYDLYVDIQNVLGIDLPDTGNDSFYTTIYGTGGVQVKGGPTMPLTIDVQAQPEKGSLFALNLASQGVSSSEAFITFVDSHDTRNTPTEATRPRGRRGRKPMDENSSKLNLDIMAHVTPDATLKLVMNQAVDDHISVSGSGDLRVSIHDDDIKLFGTYMVNRGFYRLSLQDVINKNFDVIKGSSVAFEGDPMSARLDITARHVVNYVPLRDLSPDMTGNVHVNCLLRIGGTLEAPTVAFDLELPQGTEEEKSVLRSYTSTEEQMNLQFIYLLGLGKFYTPDVAQTSGATDNMESLISTTISGQINKLLSGIISNENWNVASNIRAENMMTGANDLSGENWENMEVEGILEGRLLDNRLLVNGNFGYRNNPMYATNFVGDFDIRYLLTGGLSVKGYNRTNDRYFSKTSLTTQGVGLVYQRDFDRLLPRRKRKQKQASVQPTDSVQVK